MDKISGKPAISGSKPDNSSAAEKAAAAAAKVAGKKADPVTSKVLTDAEVQAELDRVKASEEAWTPPKDAIKNSDGTYSVIDGEYKITYNADGSTAGMELATDSSTGGTRGLGNKATVVGTVENDDGTTTVKYSDGRTETLNENFDVVGSTPSDSAGGDGEISADLNGGTEDTVVADGGSEFFQDDAGNYYTMNADGGYDLAYYADGSLPDDALNSGSDDIAYADNTYTDPDTGAVWTLADNGEWNTDFNYDDYYASQDSTLADNTDYTDNADNLYAGNDYADYNDYGDYNDYSDYEYAKRGGLITMMKNGGVTGYAPGGIVEYNDNGNGTYSYWDTNGDYVTVSDYGDELSRTGEDGYPVYDKFKPTATSYGAFGEDPVTTRSTPTPDQWPSGFVSNGDGTATMVYDDGSTMTIDENNNPIDATEATEISGAGGGNRSWYSDLGSALTKGFTGATKLGSDALSGITGALGTTAGAAGAGALVATLLGQDFSGNTDSQNQGLDMSKVGLINPRTTDFGIGPTNFVGYDQYGTGGGDYTPNEELLRNLNAPGFNPVNEGDYGYEEVPVEEEAPKMASGGLSSMATPVASYYTFGQPADILANLGMRPQPPSNPPEMMPQIGQQQSPQQTQQQGLPQQAPPQMMQQTPQGMPQQGMMPQQQGMPPPMRKGGLPHVSNVPLTQGRMDFRQGSAVHGEGDGQSDDIPAMLADGEYVIDAETVAQIGNGSTKAGAQALDKFREGIRAHKRSAPINKIPPKTKALTSYLKGAK